MRRALATVDLESVRSNVASLIGRLSPGAGLMAVVKANGYGHGAVPVARASLAAGAESLGVATAAEARELREAGISSPLIVLGPLTGADLETALAADAEVLVWSLPFLREIVRLRHDQGGRARVHVKLDTGMRRLGLYPRDLPRFLDELATEPELQLAGLMTHFATADEDDEDFFDYQLRAFDEAVQPALLRAADRIRFHCANSAATIRFPQSHFDLVRCGIAIYGLSPFQTDPWTDGLKPALRLTSYVADIKRLTEGDTVGYGRAWTAPGNHYVAAVPIGYGDGVSRGLSNRGRVLIGGRPLPIAGRVSMDLITVDLGPARPAVNPGDEVVLIGGQGEEFITAEEVAAVLGTINYEITCNLSSRVERAYQGT
ncbi:MAG: alanine racemase [Thermoleophilia bacterium]